MVRGYNKVIIMGNLARDPEIRYTFDKKPVVRLVVAVNRTWTSKTGELQKDVDFIPVVVWGTQAENCNKYLQKGRAVLVEGRLQIRSFTTSAGEKRWVTEVVANSVQFLGGKPQEESTTDYDFGSLRDEGLEEEFELPTEFEREDEEDIPF